jgi:hypothetical protein
MLFSALSSMSCFFFLIFLGVSLGASLVAFLGVSAALVTLYFLLFKVFTPLRGAGSAILSTLGSIVLLLLSCGSSAVALGTYVLVFSSLLSLLKTPLLGSHRSSSSSLHCGGEFGVDSIRAYLP